MMMLPLTRLDLSNGLNRMCKYLHAPHSSHWFAIKRIFVIFKVLLRMVFVFSHQRLVYCLPILMLIGLEVLMIVDLPWVCSLLWEYTDNREFKETIYYVSFWAESKYKVVAIATEVPPNRYGLKLCLWKLVFRRLPV
jgi:hypothetical protein